MDYLEKKIVVLVALIFVFQFTFPQYSYAQNQTLNKPRPTQGILLMASATEPIFSDYAWSLKPVLPMAGWREAPRRITVDITAYSSTPDQTFGDPFITANGTRVKEGIVAANFLPFGTKIKIPSLYGDKVFSVEDRMNQRYYYRLDIWMETREEAKIFGIKHVEVEIY